MVNRGQNIQYFWENKGCESDGDDSHKRLLEHQQTHHHYDYALIDGNPNPDEKGFRIHLSTFPKTHI
jgi:hypothetical protein